MDVFKEVKKFRASIAPERVIKNLDIIANMDLLINEVTKLKQKKSNYKNAVKNLQVALARTNHQLVVRFNSGQWKFPARKNGRGQFEVVDVPYLGDR